MQVEEPIRGAKVGMDRVRQMIAYDAESGSFTWICSRKGRSARPGAPAGCMRGDGYVRIVIDGQFHYAHRLAWQFEFGPIPEDMEIDHIDHNPANNKISNLRLVTKSGNRKNRSRDSRNSSGINGVYWASHAKAWCAQIRSERETIHIGYFKNLADAAQARKQAEADLGFHSNHGALK